MSRGNSNQEVKDYVCKFVGVNSDHYYLYQFFDKKTKELISCPEEEQTLFEETQNKTNLKKIGSLEIGLIAGVVYVKPSQNIRPEWARVAFRLIPEGTLYVDAQNAVDAVLRGDWITWESQSFKLKDFLEFIQTEKLLKVKMKDDEGDPEKSVFAVGSLNPRVKKKKK